MPVISRSCSFVPDCNTKRVLVRDNTNNSTSVYNFSARGCNIDSQKIPQNDADAINALFDNGITIWHDESYMFNYNVNNDCTGLTDTDKGDIIIGELGNLDNTDNEENNN